MARRKPAPRAPITEPQRLDMARRFSAGEPAKLIAAEYGVHPTYPNKLARNRGLPNRSGDVDFNLRLRADVADLLHAEARRQRTSPCAIGAEAIAAYIGATER